MTNSTAWSFTLAACLTLALQACANPIASSAPTERTVTSRSIYRIASTTIKLDDWNVTGMPVSRIVAPRIAIVGAPVTLVAYYSGAEHRPQFHCLGEPAPVEPTKIPGQDATRVAPDTYRLGVQVSVDTRQGLPVPSVFSVPGTASMVFIPTVPGKYSFSDTGNPTKEPVSTTLVVTPAP